MRKAIAYIPANSVLLDVGCHKGELLKQIAFSIKSGTGVDPLCDERQVDGKIALIKGDFPEVPDSALCFDCITALAVVEHIPAVQQQEFLHACFKKLHAGGRLILTVPNKKVDIILALLKAVKLIDGMSAEQHHGFDVKGLIPIAEIAGFKLLKHEKFQLGLNNLFVLEKHT
jgi:2-polyprenyl-3-methyl-5-hydroxy-6-metoxy-1,4-benzoquinol methylase